ncbi:hypothetical protein T4D_12730 [Trichinella pseudospiralis]|uniref:Uncharacterized protein n=1 Tax=Trichinella pseudospiralis TaxID=6337 RepID=A0A0V1G1R5_TRIPS|nr:hypothetical protein T4D_12730 [Trichinella pseudospiralis]
MQKSMYSIIALAIGIFILQFCATNERQYWINCPKECNREDSLSTTLFLEQRQLCTLFSITITSTFVPTVICLKASLAANLKFTSSRDAFETSSVANAEVTQFKLLQPLQFLIGSVFNKDCAKDINGYTHPQNNWSSRMLCTCWYFNLYFTNQSACCCCCSMNR